MVNSTYGILAGGRDFKTNEEFIMKFVKSICIATFMMFASAVYADPAVIITNFGCGGLDGDGGGWGTTDTHVVMSNNGKGGNVNFKCHATGVANSQGRAVHWNFDNTGAVCNTLFGTTEDWKSTVDTEGNAVLSCRIHIN